MSPHPQPKSKSVGQLRKKPITDREASTVTTGLYVEQTRSFLSRCGRNVRARSKI